MRLQDYSKLIIHCTPASSAIYALCSIEDLILDVNKRYVENKMNFDKTGNTLACNYATYKLEEHGKSFMCMIHLSGTGDKTFGDIITIDQFEKLYGDMYQKMKEHYSHISHHFTFCFPSETESVVR